MSSLVTTNNCCVLSLISMPAGPIFSGHLLPKSKLSTSINLLFCMAYLLIRLSCPAPTYKNFSSALNFKPYQDFAMLTESIIFSDLVSMSSMLWYPCPLLVTAMYLPVLLTSMFNGRSPSAKEVPAGFNFQPLAS